MLEETTGGAVDPDAPLLEAGIDSLAVMEMAGKVRTLTGVELAEDDLVDSPTARLLAAHVKAAQSNPDAVTPRLDAVDLYEQVCETSGWLGGWTSD